MKNQFSTREKIIEAVNQLFYYTDHQDWEYLQTHVFAKEILLDMVSIGAEEVVKTSSVTICNMWKEGFQGIDAIHHQGGNYIVVINGINADVKAYAVATHYKEKAANGKVRTFVGSYDIGLIKLDIGWRINKLKYNLKYMDGNINLF